MIRINLLGDSAAADASQKLWMAGYIASVVFSLAIVGMFYTSVSGSVDELVKEQNDLQSQLDGLMKQTKLVRDLEAKKDTLREKLSLIARLKKSKTGPVRVMDDLNSAVPASVWLRDIAEKTGSIKIRGRALNNQDIAMFMQNLERSEYFKDIELKESRQMYYSKRTGAVSPTPEVNALRKGDFQQDSRPTKEAASKTGVSSGAKWGIKRTPAPDGKQRKSNIESMNVKIKEFVISAQVLYEGQLSVKEVEKKDKE